MSLIRKIIDAIGFLTITGFIKNGDNNWNINENNGDNNNNNGCRNGSSNGSKTEGLKASIKFFPIAGLFIGAFLAAVFFILHKFSTIQIASLISLLCLFIITGGLHFDGLSDTADGLFAYLKSRDRTRFYKAMKDVNTGFAGSAAMIFYILIMWAGIDAVNIKFVYLSLFTFPVVGRYSIVLTSYFLNTPEDFKGIGSVFTESTGLLTLVAASVLTVAIIYLFLNLSGIFSLSVSALSVLILGLYFSKKFGGVNGDMIGFSVKISEIVYIIALCGFYKAL